MNFYNYYRVCKCIKSYYDYGRKDKTNNNFEIKKLLKCSILNKDLAFDDKSEEMVESLKQKALFIKRIKMRRRDSMERITDREEFKRRVKEDPTLLDYLAKHEEDVDLAIELVHEIKNA